MPIALTLLTRRRPVRPASTTPGYESEGIRQTCMVTLIDTIQVDEYKQDLRISGPLSLFSE
jgi:hypothetical protein